MADLPFHPMIGNLIAILQLGGTIIFGRLIADRLLVTSNWLWQLATGMVLISQIAYIVTFFPEGFWILQLMAWGLMLGGIWFIGYRLLNNQFSIKSWRVKSLADWLVLLLSLAYVLLAFCPPTQADALDYHWGVPLYIIRHHHWPPMEMWLSGSLAGIGEIYILLGMLLNAENLSSLLQAIGIVGFAYWIAQGQDRQKSDFLRMFILGVPVLLFFVTGPKPQLFPQVLTALALYLTIQRDRLELKTYSLIVLLLCGAAQQKLSFVLTGGVIGLWASYKTWPSNRHGILVAVGIVAFFFVPRTWWNLQQVPEPGFLTWLTPLPEYFTSRLQAYREQDWWFPFNLIFPDSFGSISAIIGIHVLIVGTFHSSDRRWREVLGLTCLASILTYLFGQPIARSFNEFLLWIAVGIASANTTQRLSTLGFIGIKCQTILVLGMAIIGLWSLFPGILSSKLRFQVLNKTAHNFQVMHWANKIIPDDSIVTSEFRSVSFINNDFAPLKYLGSDLINQLIHKKNKSLYVISPRVDLNILYPSLKMIDFNKNFFKGTRNPFNSGDTYSGYLYLNSED